MGLRAQEDGVRLCTCMRCGSCGYWGHVGIELVWGSEGGCMLANGLSCCGQDVDAHVCSGGPSVQM